MHSSQANRIANAALYTSDAIYHQRRAASASAEARMIVDHAFYLWAWPAVTAASAFTQRAIDCQESARHHAHRARVNLFALLELQDAINFMGV